MRDDPTRVAARVRDLLSDRSDERDRDPGRVRASSPARARLRDRLAARFPLRIDPGRRAAAAVGVGVVVTAVLTGLWVMAQRPGAIAVTSVAAPSRPPGATLLRTVGNGSPHIAGESTGASTAPVAPVAQVVIDIVGRVRRPGVYRVATGSRVDDAVHAAGGALPGTRLDSLNLAAKVVDGEQIRVGLTAPGAEPTVPGAEVGAGAGVVDLNTAGLQQLQALPGVGPVLAQRILDWRAEHGRFDRVDQLNDVSGIGDAKYAALRAHATV